MATNNSLKNQLKARRIMVKGLMENEVMVNQDLGVAAGAENLPVVENSVRPAFKLGYKAYIQLALKTGMYKTLNVMEVFNGQLKFWDPVTEQLIIDPEAKISNAIIGYAGYFELFSGFKKCVYFTRDSLVNRRKRRVEGDINYKKIVLKDMLSKWGILSLDTQQAYVPELHEEVLLYKPLLKEEDIYSLRVMEGVNNGGC
jgi:recombination protein RecT